MRLPHPLGCLYFVVKAIGALLRIGRPFPFLLIAAVFMFLLGLANSSMQGDAAANAWRQVGSEATCRRRGGHREGIDDQWLV